MKEELLKIPPRPERPGEIWELSKPPYSLIMIISIHPLRRGSPGRLVYWAYNIQKRNKFSIKDRALLAKYRKVKKAS